MTTNLELTGCRLHNDYPIPLYLMNDVNPSLIVSPGVPYNLYWFIDCKHIVTHEWIPANYFVILPLEGIRTNAYNS